MRWWVERVRATTADRDRSARSKRAVFNRPAIWGKRHMRIERRYTKDGQSPYADIEFRLTTSEIRNPDGSVVFKLDNVEVPEFWSQVASDVLAQKYFRKAGVPARLKKVEEKPSPRSCGARSPTRTRSPRCPRRSASSASIPPSRCSIVSPAPGPIGAGRAAISTPKPTRRPSSTSCATCWRCRCARRTRRSGSTPACTGPTASTARARATTTSILHRQADQVEDRLRASAAARLLHPVDQRRPRQRRRHHGPVGARGAPVQIRLRHRHQFLARCAAKAKSSPAAASRPA